MAGLPTGLEVRDTMRLGKFPRSTGDLRTDAIRQFRWAMAGEGLTPEKLRVTTAVLDLPAVAEALAGVAEARRPAVAYDVIAAAARELGDSLPHRILRTALGIDYEGGARNLTERRETYTSLRDAHTLYYIEQKMLEALVTALGGVPGVRPGGDVPGAGAVPGPRAWNVPYVRDPHFLGRDDLVAAVHGELAAGRAAALAHTVTRAVSGLGGIGKTALAVEFAYRYAGDYDVVWWLRSEEPTALAGDYAALAAPLGLDVRGASRAETVRAVREWLNTHDRWLLVFDNAERDEDLAPYLPGLRGHVLVTSRSAHWSTIATVFDVPALDPAAAAELVLRRTGGRDAEAAARLARKLDGIPKVIEVAAGLFARGAGVSLARFADRLDDGAAATSGVWDAAFDKAVAGPGARAVLAACAVLSPDDVSDELVADVTALPATDVDQALGALRAQQILRLSLDSLTMHRLVRMAVRERLDAAEVRAAARRVADLLLALDPVPDPAGFAAVRRVQVHAPYLADALGDDGRLAPLLAWYATCLRRDGAYQAARRIAERAVSAAAGAPPRVLGDALRVLAIVLRDTGELDAADEVGARAVGVAETAFGPDAVEVAEQLHVLATIRCDRGDLPGARDAAARAVELISAARGPEHPDAGRPLEVLAWVLRELGSLDGARSVAERALAITERAAGPDHLEVAWRLDALAVILRELGSLEEARAAAERGLAISEAVLGPRHRSVGSQLGVLARILRSLGELGAARAAAERAVELTRAAHGADHPVLAVQLGNLALVLADIGDWEAARTAIEDALRMSRAVLGETHRDVSWQLAVLARVLRRLGETAAALDAAERSVVIARATLDPDHPALADRVAQLAALRAESRPLRRAAGS